MHAEAVDHFVTHGWAIFPGVVDAPTLDGVRARLSTFYPTFEQYDADRDAYAPLADGQFGGLRLWPLDDLALDLLPLDQRLVALAEGLLNTTELQLLRAGYQGKYAGTVDFDQVLHYDYPNHSLVVPAQDDIISFFLYISDVTDDLGPTALVSDTVRGALTAPTHPTPDDRPDLYAVEERATGSAGSVLAYRSTTFHRGTKIKGATGVRLTLGYSYGRPAPWTGYFSFPRLGEEPGLKGAVPAMSPRQRELIGFPPPGHSYWTEETLAAVAGRYAGFDPAPYLATS